MNMKVVSGELPAAAALLRGRSFEFALHQKEEDRQSWSGLFNFIKPTGYVMHHQFNIQQLYALPTLCLCVL